jgi:hypothetical protein
MYDLSRKPVRVSLSPDEVAQSVAFIQQVRHDKSSHSVRDQMFDQRNTSEGINQIGHLGEMAVGKVLGVPVDMEIRTGGDEGYDLFYEGKTVQVKTSTRSSLIFNAKHLFSADTAILCQYIGTDRQHAELSPHFVLWGWIDRQTFLENYQIKDYGYGDRLVVNLPLLRPLATLTPYQTTTPLEHHSR